MNTQFSPMAALRFGWKAFKKGKKFWIIVALIGFTVGNSGGSSFSIPGSESDSDYDYSAPSSIQDFGLAHISLLICPFQ